MRVFTSIESILAAKGELLGTSDWHTIGQSRIQLFADATDDQQWIHVDHLRAQSGPYGSTIAHGFLTLSMIPALTAEVIQYTFDPVRLNYGLDRVRFITPVLQGAKVRDSITLIDAVSSKAGLRLSLRHSMEIEAIATPAFVADTISMIVTPA